MATGRKFPADPIDTAEVFCTLYFDELARASRSIDPGSLGRAAAVLTEAYIEGATVFACGNGGSAAVANHLQCDHVKGVRTATDLLTKVVSLTANVELITAIANDINYEDVFRYQLQSHSRPGDVLVAISSSGRSPNVVAALRWANEHEVKTISLTGFDGGQASQLSDVSIQVECSNYGVIEDMHQAVMHTLAQYIRQSRMSPQAINDHTF